MIEEKSLLRMQLRKEYASLTDAYKEAADASLISLVESLPLFQSCRKIFLFASTGNEVNTHNLIQKAFTLGKTVLLPRCHAKGIMEFYEYEGALQRGRFGIYEPTGIVSITPDLDDLMIVPGLAFTPNGVRMGQGGGYYDRYLSKHPCITIGLCRNAFLKNDLPAAWNDLPVNYVITETTVYQCKNGAS